MGELGNRLRRLREQAIKHGMQTHTIDDLVPDIETLQAENKRLREALEEALEVVEVFFNYVPDDEDFDDMYFRFKRMAKKALEQSDEN